MFFMDIAKQEFKSKVALNVPCQQCKHAELETRAEIKFLKLSILPLFPLSTHYKTLCNHCKNKCHKVATEKDVIPIPII